MENNKTLLRYANVACLIFVIATGFGYGDNVKGSSQKDFVNMLITVSAIVFGVMGAWLSLMKIELQVGIESASTVQEASSHMKRGRGLIYPITISSMILIGSVLFSLSFYILPNLALSSDWIGYIKKVSFSAICTGAYGIIYTLCIVIFQGAEFLIQLSDINQETRARLQRNQHRKE
ncbi:hypothetical protein [Vibrio campbellii]|uniref:hypothetical protein n=1 Tax=Vibrio campbellii TaxID=680 RepID=UPI0012FE241F|nr:hypothetical protein [Vibrio campbellii]